MFAAVADAGVVVQDVDAALGGEHGLGQRLDRLRRRSTSSVCALASPPAASISPATAPRASPLTSATCTLRAVAGEQQRGGAADSRSRAGDHGDLAGEVDGWHRFLLLVVVGSGRPRSADRRAVLLCRARCRPRRSAPSSRRARRGWRRGRCAGRSGSGRRARASGAARRRDPRSARRTRRGSRGPGRRRPSGSRPGRCRRSCRRARARWAPPSSRCPRRRRSP